MKSIEDQSCEEHLLVCSLISIKVEKVMASSGRVGMSWRLTQGALNEEAMKEGFDRVPFYVYMTCGSEGKKILSQEPCNIRVDKD